MGRLPKGSIENIEEAQSLKSRKREVKRLQAITKAWKRPESKEQYQCQ